MNTAIIKKIFTCAVILVFAWTNCTYGLPEIKEVVSGSAEVGVSGSTMTINATDHTIIDYNSFNILQDEAVIVNLPSSSSQILNRDIGGEISRLLGGLDCNGIFILVNTSGVYVGPAANINAASLVLSTRGIDNQDFLDGNLLFKKLSDEELDMLLVNEGTINIQDGGFGVLIAGAIENKGKIVAPIGKIALASGDAVTLDIAGEGLISIAISEAVAKGILDAEGNPITDQIKNDGTIEGGVVILKAESLPTIFEKVINLEGILRADTAKLDASGAIVSLGTIEAGTLEEKGASCRFAGTTIVGEAYLSNADGAVELSGELSGTYNDEEDILLNGGVDLIGDTTLNADSDGDDEGGMIDMQGNDLDGVGFDLALSANEDSTLDGDITNVGLFEISSSRTNDVTYTSPAAKAFSVDTVKANYRARLDRTVGDGSSGDPRMIYDITQLQEMQDNLDWHYKLANNIDASATQSWDPYLELYTELGILDLDANGGINPATGNPWGEGDQFRLVFVTSAYTKAESLDIGYYNAFVQGVADAAGLGGTWKAIASVWTNSTTFVNANDNTQTRPGVDPDMSIILIDGSTIVATGYADLWDGNIGKPPAINKTEFGVAVLPNSNTSVPRYLSAPVWAGTQASGTHRTRHSLGNNTTGDGSTLSDSGKALLIDGTTQWIRAHVILSTYELPMYAMSDAQSIESIEGPPQGFDPIETFTGVFDGDNKTVSNLYINRPSEQTVGLFGITEGAEIKNATVAGNVLGYEYVGGLVGRNDATPITNCHTDVEVLGDYSYAGGLAGANQNNSTIINCSASGNVTSQADDGYAVGGLIGANTSSSVTDSHATGEVRGDSYIGGLIGESYDAGETILRCYATGDVYGVPGQGGCSYAGGLVGYNQDTPIIDSYATGDVYFDEAYAGGLVGYNEESDITCSYATGDVLPNYQDIGYSHEYRGGLVGYCEDSTIESSYATGEVQGRESVGGLVGYLEDSTIRHSRATGDVYGIYGYIGGFAGRCEDSTILRSYAKGNVAPVEGEEGEHAVGGFVGQIYDTRIMDCYAQGDVSGFDSVIGGFVGYSWDSEIENCYSTGAVSGDHNIGGFEGAGGSRDYEANFWLQTETHNAGLEDSGDDGDISGVDAKDDTEMQTQSTFENAGWDFLGLWTVGSYPHLVWEDMLTLITNGNIGCEGPSGCHFLIHNVNELQFMKYAPYANFMLANDIDASGTQAWNPYGGNGNMQVMTLGLDNGGPMIYQGFEPVGNDEEPFTGFFCGDCHTISNLYINRPESDDIGLFGRIDEATIGRVALENSNVTGDDNVGALVGYAGGYYDNKSYIKGASIVGGQVQGDYRVGGLVGYLGDYTQIYCSNSSATVNGESYVGGLVGEAGYGEIERSFATGEVFGDYRVGGLVGSAYSASITDSYATGNVTVNASGYGEAGGLLGNAAYCDVENCYATGVVSGQDSPSYLGGFRGYGYGGTYTSNYWLKTATHNAGLNDSGDGDVSGVTAKNTSQMQQQSTFSGWDFGDVWGMPPGAPPAHQPCSLCDEPEEPPLQVAAAPGTPDFEGIPWIIMFRTDPDSAGASSAESFQSAALMDIGRNVAMGEMTDVILLPEKQHGLELVVVWDDIGKKYKYILKEATGAGI